MMLDMFASPWRARLLVAGCLVIVAATACSNGDGDGSPTETQGTIVPPAEDVSSVGIVVPEDEIVLNGWLYGSENDPIVVLSHMRPNDQTAWTPFAEELAENGYAALTFDFRGYGISAGDQDFEKLDDDLSAAINYLRATGRDEIFLVGASMGGTTSLVVAAQEDVAGVVSVSAPSEFEDQSANEAMVDVAEPALLLAAEEDTAAMVSLDELLENASGIPESNTYPGDEHGTDLVLGIYASDVQGDILQFLEEHSG